jgi:hypothetical protein
MTEGREPAQDLNQVLGAELAGSTTGGNELGEAHLAHRFSFAASSTGGA